METVRIKYDNFKRTLNDMVRDEHFHLIEPVMKLQVEDVLILMKESNNLEHCKQSIMSAIGFAPALIESYPEDKINLMNRYVEYFFRVSQRV